MALYALSTTIDIRQADISVNIHTDIRLIDIWRETQTGTATVRRKSERYGSSRGKRSSGHIGQNGEKIYKNVESIAYESVSGRQPLYRI